MVRLKPDITESGGAVISDRRLSTSGMTEVQRAGVAAGATGGGGTIIMIVGNRAGCPPRLEFG
jgi:hypothetical protein